MRPIQPNDKQVDFGSDRALGDPAVGGVAAARLCVRSN